MNVDNCNKLFFFFVMVLEFILMNKEYCFIENLFEVNFCLYFNDENYFFVKYNNFECCGVFKFE